ncbi:MAG: hypothetical protein IKR48_05455 [Kiritimatiellae bacterium]|nr:hypothetical protein [Kiritimatiellia bacterium]
MTEITRLNTSITSAAATQQSETQGLGKPQGTAKPLLGGTSLTVTTALSGDLEKLVARVKDETQNTRLALTLGSLNTLNEALTDVQKRKLGELDTLDQQLKGLNGNLESLQADLETKISSSQLMELKIQELEAAVERAIQEGKDHNEAVRKAKETRDQDQAKLDQLKNAEAKDEAAIAAAENALASSQAALDAAVAVQSGDAAKIQSAQNNLTAAQTQKRELDNQIASIKQDITAVQNQIASVNQQMADCLSSLGEKALNNIAATLHQVADAFNETEETQSSADQKKEEAKEIANNPLNIIREALDRLDEVMTQTIGENREVMV